MNTLALICGLILLFSLLRGIRRGFLRSLLSVISFFLSIAFTAAVTPALYRTLAGSTNVSGFFKDQAEALLESSAISGTTGAAGSAGLDFSTPGSVMQSFVRLAAGNAGAGSALAAGIANVMMGILAFLISWILISIVLGILSHAVGRALRHRGIRAVDRALGIPVGLLKGLIIVWIILGICAFLALAPFGESLGTQISSSPFLTALAKINPLSAALSSAVGGLV